MIRCNTCEHCYQTENLYSGWAIRWGCAILGYKDVDKYGRDVPFDCPLPNVLCKESKDVVCPFLDNKSNKGKLKYYCRITDETSCGIWEPRQCPKLMKDDKHFITYMDGMLFNEWKEENEYPNRFWATLYIYRKPILELKVADDSDITIKLKV